MYTIDTKASDTHYIVTNEKTGFKVEIAKSVNDLETLIEFCGKDLKEVIQ